MSCDLSEYLKGKAKDYYNVFYKPGMSYVVLKEQLQKVIEKLEAKFKYPTVPDSLQYTDNLGAFGLMSAILAELAQYDKKEYNMYLAKETFWQRWPSHLLWFVKTKAETLKNDRGLDDPDVNCILDAAMELDQSSEFVNKYNNSFSVAGTAAVPPPTPVKSKVGLSLDTHVGYINTSHSSADQPSRAPTVSAGTGVAPQNGGQQPSRGGGFHGNSRGGYGRGSSNSVGSGNRGGWRGGSRGGPRGGFRGGYGGARGGGNNRHCWFCNDKSHIATNCPSIDFKFRPPCSRCRQNHRYGEPCPPGASASHQSPTSQQALQGASATATAVSQPTTATTTATNNRCKFIKQNFKNMNKDKVTGVTKVASNKILAINWSKYPKFDEMRDEESESLPVEEVILPFEVPKPQNYKVMKPNKATFFIKDRPDNFEGELKDSKGYCNRLLGESKAVAKVPYPCHSQTCCFAHHDKAKGRLGEDFVKGVLETLKDEFPLCQLAECDSSNAERINAQKEMRDNTDEYGVPICSVMAAHSKKKERKKKENEWNLDFEDGAEERILEAKESVIKIGNFQWGDPGLAAMAMKDLMLISIKLGSSGPLHALLDTGASMSIVNCHLTDNIGGQWTKANTAICGIGDTIGKQALKSEPLKVIIGGIEMNPFSFYSIPNVDTGYDIILGRDFLSENKIKLFPSIRKVKIGHKLSNGDKSSFSVYQKDIPSEECNDIVDDVTCIDIPCYLVGPTVLVADEVNTIQVIPNTDYIGDDSFLNNDELITYLEMDPALTGMYPNMGAMDNNLGPQELQVLVAVDAVLPAGAKIGNIKTAVRDSLPKKMENDRKPPEKSIYSIMTDQEVAEVVNSARVTDKVCSNPTAILDEIQRFGNLPMKDTPPEHALGHRARLFPPRDMDLFMSQHEEWKKNPVPDGVRDEWTMKRIKQEFKLPEGELTEEQKHIFYDMIHKYRVAFTRNLSDIHCNDGLSVCLQCDVVWFVSCPWLL